MRTEAADQLFESLRVFLAQDPDRSSKVGTAGPLEREVEIRPATWQPWLEHGGHNGRGQHCPVSEDVSRVAWALVEELPTRDGSDRRVIDRRKLVDLAAAASADNDIEVIRLWVATMMWGSGTSNGRGPWRTAQGLADERLTSTLSNTAALAREGNLTHAYRAFRLAGCGEAFFTKWFWAASLTSDVRPVPLILDLRVRNTIGAVVTSGPPLKLRGASGYERYCALIDHVAQRLTDQPSLTHIDAEKVEWILFDRSPGNLHARQTAASS